jgi:hypothetical protein
MVAGELIDLGERIWIYKHLDSLASGSLAFGMLLFYCTGRASVDRFINSLA